MENYGIIWLVGGYFMFKKWIKKLIKTITNAYFHWEHNQSNFYLHDTKFHVAQINISRLMPISISMILATVIALVLDAFNQDRTVSMVYFYLAYALIIGLCVVGYLIARSKFIQRVSNIWTLRAIYWIYWAVITCLAGFVYLLDAYSSDKVASIFAFYIVFAAVPIFNIWEILVFSLIPNAFIIGIWSFGLITIKDTVYTMIIYELFMIAISQAIYQTFYRLLDAEKKLEEQRVKFEQLSLQDPLTKLYNRLGIDKAFQDIKLHHNPEEYLYTITIDIDCFKEFNDTYGHSMGDQCLVKFANTIQECFMMKAEAIGRTGGDEFLILITGVSLSDVKEQMNHLYDALTHLSTTHENNHFKCGLTISSGGAFAQLKELNSWVDLYESADQYLYEMKNEGRNQYKIAQKH